MKRLLVLLTVILLCCATPAALANRWGLVGELLSQVADVDTWNGYYCIGGQAGEAAVMHSTSGSFTPSAEMTVART